MGGAWHVHQITRRNRQLRGQTCAFGTNRVFGDLHHQALAFMHQGADAFNGLAFTQGNFGGMNKSSTIQTDIHKGSLHAGQNPDNLAFVDITDNAPALGTFDMHLLQNTVLYHCHARFHRRDVDQDLFTHGWVSFRRHHSSATSRRCRIQRTVRFCQQGMPKCPSSSAVSHTGRPTTAE